ncbi:MAG: DUF2905 domain-containing protein [Caldilineae bacterium]|nr:DUF2905 domain-containing protein [Anaerolineae bacterium]MCB0200325.1 DUF2905 domain-containing protein [Anaerolineae bacterium]MCB0254708.1 DUF2905 domain-containing protein [Anaerolineae bacterium]MCB9155254.1 DUF2905 domain-containing protein [Caldilineae bacterium]
MGVALVVIGLVIWAGGLSWLERLPGNIRIQGESITVFIPIASMIVISVLLTIVLNLLIRIFRR